MILKGDWVEVIKLDETVNKKYKLGTIHKVSCSQYRECMSCYNVYLKGDDIFSLDFEHCMLNIDLRKVEKHGISLFIHILVRNFINR